MAYIYSLSHIIRVSKKRKVSKMKKQVITINTVARLAGVSTATVSRVMNNSSKVRPSTAAKVNYAIKELGFEPNEAAVFMARLLGEYRKVDA